MKEIKNVYIWEGGSCLYCASQSGKIFEDESEIGSDGPPVHKNCSCWISVLELDDKGNVKPSNEKFEKLMQKTILREGGYVDNPKLIEQPTKTGITQNTLDNYNARHPKFNFPKNVENLKQNQIKQIYKEDFYDKYRIDEIKNDNIREDIFDLFIMSNPITAGTLIQKSLNDSVHSGIKTDGVMGSATLNVLNSLNKGQIADFIDKLIENRLKQLESLPDFSKYPGWVSRTKSYK